MEMETEVQRAKACYNEALQSLEKISDEIHKLREDQKLNEYHEDEVSRQTSIDQLTNTNFCNLTDTTTRAVQQ